MITHKPVLTNQVIHYINPEPGAVIIDATLGLGGHTKELMNFTAGKCTIYGVEVDDRNLNRAKEVLREYENVHFVRDNFENLEQIGREILKKEKRVDAILLDLGLSSPHVEEPERGFSFQHEGPLDMRFDTRSAVTAANIVNEYPLEHLISIFKTYGEEKFSNKIAREIVRERKRDQFATTTQLADFIKRIFSKGDDRFFFKQHPATRVFQALRIAANRELEVLNTGLQGALNALSPGGRIVVISYHSLEDRIVKNFFKNQKAAGVVEILTKKPITPDQEEMMSNRRSRSAKLRAAAKAEYAAEEN